MILDPIVKSIKVQLVSISIVLVVQYKTFEEAQQILENDLKVIDEYFKNARLIINPLKT